MVMSELLDVRETSLDEWLDLLRTPPTGKIFVRNMFPTDSHRDEWLKTAHLRSESEVKLLLRHFLVSTGSNPLDSIRAEWAVSNLKEKKGSVEDLSEHDRRLIRYVVSGKKYPVWEGLGWIIDLLPQHPRMALNVIDAFFQACWTQLTDNYISGLFDAQAIIRSRYIESTHTVDPATRVLLSLDWRELEWLCAVVYERMGFEVVVTPKSNDDGADVFASVQAPGQKGLVIIQSKKWDETNPVGKAEVRELLGTIDLHRAPKGVLVTTGRFEAGALLMASADPRIELLGRQQMIELLNEHCGADWFTSVDRLLSSIKLREHITSHDEARCLTGAP
jgi:restriction system protein